MESNRGAVKKEDVNKLMKTGKWHDVALIDGTSIVVDTYLPSNALSKIVETQGFVKVDMEQFQEKMKLDPSKKYIFRIAAVNSLGVGPWSPMSAFNTTTPNTPLAPVGVKLSTAQHGKVMLSWKVNPKYSGELKSFQVSLAMKDDSNEASGNGAVNFRKIYEGLDTKLVVGQDLIQQATIDTNGGSPAYTFLICGVNKYGLGETTQVRWLQKREATDII